MISIIKRVKQDKRTEISSGEWSGESSMFNKDFLKGSCLRTDLNKREQIMGKFERKTQGQVVGWS